MLNIVTAVFLFVCLYFWLINIVNRKFKLLFVGMSQNFKAETSFEVGPKVRKKKNTQQNL